MQNKNGSGDAVLDWVVIVAAFLLFFRTADILSYFAPSNLNDLFGFDVSLIYGAVCALLVEGAMLALHFNKRASIHTPAQVVKWALFVISGVCQVFDGFVITDTLAQQTDTMKAIFSYGVPLVPLLVVGMVVKIGHLPELDGTYERKPFIGLKAMWNNLINGEQNFTEGKK